jgi:hypothetical protein
MLGNNTGRPSLEVMADANKSGHQPNCIFPFFYTPEHSNLRRVKEHYTKSPGRQVVLHDAQAKVFYFSGRRASQIEQELPMVVAYGVKSSPECLHYDRP